MLQEIVFGIGVSVLTIGSGTAIYFNCKNKVEEYLPLMEQTFSEAKEQFEKGNFENVRQLSKQASDLRFRLDIEGGEWYYLLFNKGQEIYSMYKDIKELEKTASILE